MKCCFHCYQTEERATVSCSVNQDIYNNFFSLLNGEKRARRKKTVKLREKSIRFLFFLIEKLLVAIIFLIVIISTLLFFWRQLIPLTSYFVYTNIYKESVFNSKYGNNVESAYKSMFFFCYSRNKINFCFFGHQ